MGVFVSSDYCVRVRFKGRVKRHQNRSITLEREVLKIIHAIYNHY